MKQALVAIVLTFWFFLPACKDDSTSPIPTVDFSLTMTVKNPAGDPVPGLRISVWNHLPVSVGGANSPTDGNRQNSMPATTLNFCVATRSRSTMVIFEMDGSPLDTLIFRAPTESGEYAVEWSTQLQVPTRVFKAVYIAEDSTLSSTLYRDSVLIVLWQPDADRSILGWTSSGGQFGTEDKLLFPNVLGLPPLVHTNSSGPDSIGTFSILDSVTIVLTDTLSHQTQSFGRVVVNAANDIQLTWDPVASTNFARHEFVKSGAAILRSIDRKTGIDWCLEQNYPNPFN